jgi:hypothetical protein
MFRITSAVALLCAPVYGICFNLRRSHCGDGNGGAAKGPQTFGSYAMPAGTAETCLRSAPG